MAEQFYTILTNIGKAKIANAVALGQTVQIAQVAVGDGGGTYYNPSETQTSLVNEVWRGPASKVDKHPTNANWIVVEAAIPPDVGGFYIREVGIFDADGDLIGIGKYPETYKPTFAQNNAGKDLVIRTIFEVSNASVVELKVDPTTVIATVQRVQEEIIKHNQDSTAHSDIRNLINTHIADQNAHDIPNQIQTAISNHNQDINAHQDIRNSIANLQSQFGGSITTNGYYKLPSGLIIQWGYASSQQSSVIFPIAFPNTCLAVVVTRTGNYASAITITSYTKSGFAYYSGGPIFWIAIGN